MPKSGLADEAKTEMEQTGTVDLLIGVAGVVNVPEIQQQVPGLLKNPQESAGVSRVVITYPENEHVAGKAEDTDSVLRPFSFTTTDPSSPPWMISSSAQRVIFSLAVELNARACVVVHSDLSMLSANRLRLLMQPILEQQCDLALPVYPSRKFEGLLNHSILAPLVRALYGPRVKYPLAQDFGCSARMFQQMSGPPTVRERAEGALLWPVVHAATCGYQICQANVDVHHTTRTEGLELSDVLASVAGAAFADMEMYAPFWQRVRSSQPTATSGNLVQQISEGELVDAKPLCDSFLLGSRNLQEIWGLVLPPVTLLELKKLARCSPEAFHMPDELWVRIVYDFALAYRLRTINRGHLMGALTPLYLGWVASYVQEVASQSPQAAEQRFERLARAYEEGKPYLVSRWRWPDRFNP
jgi:glucosylglycerate synthase